MDTADDFNERAKRDIRAIKDRLAIAKADMTADVARIEVGQFTLDQLGLSPVLADANGTLWASRGPWLIRIGRLPNG